MKNEKLEEIREHVEDYRDEVGDDGLNVAVKDIDALLSHISEMEEEAKKSFSQIACLTSDKTLLKDEVRDLKQTLSELLGAVDNHTARHSPLCNCVGRPDLSCDCGFDALTLSCDNAKEKL